MGAADVVPGVSGGTMAFILGIYEELLESVKSFDLTFCRLFFSGKVKDAVNHLSWRFLLALGIGILVAIFSLAKILSWLLQNQPVLIWSFFLGLITASIFTVSRHLAKWNLAIALWMLLGAAGTYVLVGMVPVSTPNAPWFLLLSGAIAIWAMILPGISGAFILVLLGKYRYVLEAVNNRDFLTLLIVALGAGIGLLSFVRFLSWLLKRYHDATIAILAGLMFGSLRKVWPWKKPLTSIVDSSGDTVVLSEINILPAHWDLEVSFALGLMVLGFLSVVIMNLLAVKKEGA